MSKSYRAWYLLAALLAVVPAGARLLIWHRAHPPAVDNEMARAGEVLFKHEWQAHDRLSPGGDGLGPVYNATSCAACHNQGGAGGGGGLEHNVTTFIVSPRPSPHEEAVTRKLSPRTGETRTGVVHAFGVGCQETLRDIDPALPAISRPTLKQLSGLRVHTLVPPEPEGLVFLSQRNTPALFGARLIDSIPDRVIVAVEKTERLRWGMSGSRDGDEPVGRVAHLAGGRVGRFGWKAQTDSLGEFVRAACANELGLGNPGHPQPKPLGATGYADPGFDLTSEQCDQFTAFVASLPRPAERLPDSPGARANALAGRKLFDSTGCAECHTPNLGSVEGIYSDLLLHGMGEELTGDGSYGDPPQPRPGGSPGEGPAGPSEWRTPPLWGVADSAPYLHDGRAETLEGAILMHGGQGQRAAQQFARLSPAQQEQLVAFLKSLRAP